MSRSLDLRVSTSHELEIEVIVQASDEQEWLGHHPTRLDPGKVPSWSSINLLTAGSLGGGGGQVAGAGGVGSLGTHGSSFYGNRLLVSNWSNCTGVCQSEVRPAVIMLVRLTSESYCVDPVS